MALVVGLSAAVALVVSVTRDRPVTGRSWLVAVAAVAVAALGATWPAKVRDAAYVLDQQRKAYSGTAEWESRARCLSDMGRADLVSALMFVRSQIPKDARYRLPKSASPACIAFSLLPREPVSHADFDPAADWAIYDRSIPAEVRQAARSEAPLPESQRRYLVHSANFVLARPQGAATP